MQDNVCKIIASLPLLSALVCFGCSGNKLGNIAGSIAARPDPNVELLESELRWMEDNLYRLDDQLEHCVDQLQSARRNNAVLRFELAEARNSSDAPTNRSRSDGDSSRANDTGDGGPYDEESNDLTDEELFDLTAPEVKLGDPQKDTVDGEKTGSTPQDENIRLEGLPTPESILKEPSVDPGTPATKPNNPFQSDDVSTNPDVVTRILLNRQLTGGYNFDGLPGHEGIMVVIEPQNAYAQFIPKAGSLVVEVHDPTKTGLNGRVGKWKFDAVEANSMMKKSLLGKGMHVQLPWPGAPPDNEELRLTVAYEAAPGRKLRAEKTIRIEPLTSALVSKAVKAEQRWSPNRLPNTPTPQIDSPNVATRPSVDWRPNR